MFSRTVLLLIASLGCASALSLDSNSHRHHHHHALKEGPAAGASADSDADSDSEAPVIVISQRTCQPGTREKAMEAMKKVAEYLMENVPDVKAVFVNPDKDDPNLLHDIQWFGNLASFLGHVDMEKYPEMETLFGGVMQYYDRNVPLRGDVFGAWNDQVKMITNGNGGQFKFHTNDAGFLKTTGEGLEGPPVIVNSKRHVLLGKYSGLVDAVRDVTDYYKAKQPGVLVYTIAQDAEDPTLVHDLQVFANMDAFMKHVDHSDPDFPPPTYMDDYDWTVPFVGNVWSASGEKVNMVTSKMGAKFTFYDYPVTVGLIDLTNGDPATDPELDEPYRHQSGMEHPHRHPYIDFVQPGPGYESTYHERERKANTVEADDQAVAVPMQGEDGEQTDISCGDCAATPHSH